MRSSAVTELGAEQPIDIQVVSSTERDQQDRARATIIEVAEQEGP